MSHLQKKETKKREWVKNAAIIFLAVMLVLTFFSKTIMNMSLTEVTGQYIKSGTISSGVTGTGTVTANMAYNVQMDELRTVQEVLVAIGDEIEAGQVLFTLEEIENTALVEAEQTLADMQYDYNVKFIQNVDANYATENQNIENIRDSLADAIEERSKASTYETAYNQAKSAVDSAQAKVAARQSTITSLKGQSASATAGDSELALLQAELSTAQAEQAAAQSALASAQANTAAAQAAMTISLADAEAVLTSAQRSLEEMELELSYLQEDYDALCVDPSAEPEVVTEALRAVERQRQAVAYQREDLASAQAAYDNAVILNAAVTAAQEAEASAQTALSTKETAVNDAQVAIDARITELTADLSASLAAEETMLESELAVLEQAQNALSSASQSYNTSINAANATVTSLQQSLEMAIASLAEQQQADGVASQVADLALARDKEALDEQAALVERLREEGVLTEVTAPYAGTVSAVNVIAGDMVAAGQTMASVNVAGKEYTLTVVVSNEQAQMVSVGNMASVTNNFWGEIEATLTAIKDDPNNPGKNKILEFDVSGDVTDGQTLSVLVGEKGTTYDMVVPKSSIHEDSSGTYILVAVSKSTPFGSRYIAERLPVVVTASDNYNAAIETGSSYSYEYVITTSTAPLTAGEQVRLANG